MTLVTARILDPNGNVYANAQVEASFISNIPPGSGTGPPLASGSVFQTFSVSETDSFGNLSMSLTDLAVITPSGGSWNFNVLNNGRTIGFSLNTTAITGVTVDISAALQAVAAPLNSPTGFGNITTTSITNSGGYTGATPVTVSGAGNFTGVNTFNYLLLNLNSLDINAELVRGQGTGKVMTGLTGAVKVPATSTTSISDAVTGIITNSAPNTNGIAGYFQSTGLADNTINFGLNPQVMDDGVRTTGVTLNGVEATMVPLSPTTSYTAITGIFAVMAGNNNGVYPGSTAIAATRNTGNGLPLWNFGFRSQDGSCTVGAKLGKATTAGASGSQPLQLTANDGSSDFTPSITLSSAIDWTIPIGKTGRNILIQNAAGNANIFQFNDSAILNMANPTNQPIKIDASATDVGNISGGGTAPGLRISGSSTTAQNGVIIFANNRVDAVESGRITTSTKAWTLNGLVTIYNAIATAGNGLASIYGATVQRNESAADANLLTFTPPAAIGTYRLSFVLDVSAATAAVLGWTATWKDSNGNTQTPTNLSLEQSGVAAPALTFTLAASGVLYGSATISIDNSATNIVIKLTFTGTSFAAKASATIERLI